MSIFISRTIHEILYIVRNKRYIKTEAVVMYNFCLKLWVQQTILYKYNIWYIEYTINTIYQNATMHIFTMFTSIILFYLTKNYTRLG